MIVMRMKVTLTQMLTMMTRMMITMMIMKVTLKMKMPATPGTCPETPRTRSLWWMPTTRGPAAALM